ncbi:MAG: hypothetical protein IPI65_07285 [Bacteroidetes bacterium]|nr:hypothetical protein [Bacteroidota bacterium]
MPYILLIGFLITLFSCGQPNEQSNTPIVKVDTLELRKQKKENERLEKIRLREEKAYVDSLRLDIILQSALIIANQNIDKDKFIEKYAVFDDSIPVSVEINLDYHFTNSKPHLIIRRRDPFAIYIDIYTKVDNKFEKVVSHEEWTMTYVSDTIRDINGDGLSDFVVNWYGANGSCLKSFSNVYLLLQDKNSFSDDFEFINPTFSPKEKIVRGICYGHPGETEMYKYKWNGVKVDTVEYVSYERTDKGKTGNIIISTDIPYSSKSKTVKVLKSVPLEYKKIDGYGWFTGDGIE